MAQFATVAQFMATCLDEDEKIARAAGYSQQAKARARQWTADLSADGPGGEKPFLFGVKVTDNAGVGVFIANGVEKAEHVVRHDPAAVLADIAAKRRIVFLWRDPAQIERPDGAGGWNASDLGAVMEDIAAATMIDEVVRTLAEAYDSRPGYKQEWRVY